MMLIYFAGRILPLLQLMPSWLARMDFVWPSAQIHFEARHPKLPFEEDKIVDMHALVGATTQGIAVRGSTKKK
jgi:hypothetical protein